MKKISFICLFLLVFLVGCPMEEGPDYDMNYYHVNNSDYTIVYNFKITESFNDTALWESYPWGRISAWTLNPGEMYTGRMESIGVISTLEDYHMHYYFFYEDTLSAYPWDVIRDEYKVAKRVTISSWEEYEAMDFAIEFP